MKKFKNLLPYIFTVSIIVVIMAVAGTTVYADTYSGSCGDDLTWTLDTSTGVLDISGTGEMANYSYAVNESPWCSYRSYIKYVNIGDSVTSIGDYAFWRCTSLISVTISDSLTNIGDSAFGNCTSLESVAIPDSVTNICDEAFSDCSSLKNVHITDIAAWCGIDFESSYSNPLYYADNLYLNGEPITDLVIPDSATIISDYAFGNCTFLTSVTISDSVTSIGDYAFENCTSLTSVTISDSVTNIGYYTFSFCNSLTSVTIPDSVISIGYRAFIACKSLTSIIIGSSVTDIGCDAFDGTAYYNNADNWEDGVLYIGDCLIQAKGLGNVAYTVKDGTTCIADRAFYCSDITGITIPDSVTSIGYDVFDACTSLTDLILPDSVTSIGKTAFYDCSSLRSITIPDSVTNIDALAFNNTGYYNNSENWENDVLYIGNHLIESRDSITGEYVVKDGTKCIADSAFDGCVAIMSVTIPDSVTSIGSNAFNDCTSLETVTIPDSVTQIDDSVFKREYYYNLDVTIVCYENSYAHSYAVDNGFEFKFINDNIFTPTFSDINKDAWYADSVEFVVKHGYMNGMSATVFSPNSNITREQFVLILANIAGVDTNEFKNTASGFTDVKTGQWYSGAVTWAVSEGYVSGMSADKFGRGQSIQRAALARMLYNYASKNGINVEGRADLSAFGDAKEFDKAGNAWMKEPVQWAVDAGIISGMKVNGVNCVNPKGTATRAQAARMLMVFDTVE